VVSALGGGGTALSVSTTTTTEAAALADITADPVRGAVVQAVALLLTASPVLAVAIWSVLAVL
jgi:hypothetical protein